MVSYHGNREPAFAERQRGERDDLISRETVDRGAGLQIRQELLRHVSPDRFGRSAKGPLLPPRHGRALRLRQLLQLPRL
jgi:hypothetical protein